MLSPWQELCIARFQKLPDNVVISFGEDEISKKECIDHIIKDDEVGRKLIEIEKEYFKTIKENKLFMGL